MADNSIPVWDRLSGAAMRAAAQGDMVTARELASSARQAWLAHCEGVHGQEQARARMPVHSVWTRDEERER